MNGLSARDIHVTVCDLWTQIQSLLNVVLVSLKCDKNKYTSLVYLVSTPQACCQRGSESERERERESERAR